MAISILNEWSFTKDTILSRLISVHCMPVLYYSVTKAGVSYSTVQISGVTFRATQIDEDATYFYYQLDLSDTLKHLITADGYSDSLEFQEASGIYTSSMVEGEVTVTIATYNSSDVLVESSTPDYDFAHLSHDIPNESGFNLWQHVTLRNLRDQKWSNDTYNALFIYTTADVYIYNRTTGNSINLASGSRVLRQVKFAKKIQELYSKKRYYSIDEVDALLSDYLVITTGTLGTETVDAATLKADKVIFDDNDTGLSFMRIGSDYDFISLDHTSFQANKKYSYELKWVKTTKAADALSFRILGVQTSTNPHQYAENIRAEVEFNTDFDDTILAVGKNVLEIIVDDSGNYASAVIEIDYDPFGCYIPLCWEHPELGYVSYPFEGAEIESVESTKTDEVKKFLTTLIGVNELKDIKGYEAEPSISLTTTAESKYWDLFKELYSSRNVYLYIGDTGDLDNSESWVRVEVSGNYTINKNRQRNSSVFTVDLKLPKKLNIKM